MKQFISTVFFLVVLASAKSQSLQLISPNGGEVLLGGSAHQITWTYTNVDNIKIEYSLDNGLNWVIITPSYPTSALNYSWTVPCMGSNQAKVRITNTLQFTQDESNAVFTIPEPTVDITYPNGGETFASGTGQYIEWATTGVVTLALEYTMDNGITWNSIGNFPATNNYCNWISPAGLSSQARIRAYNIESTRNRDSSAAPFHLVGLPTNNQDKFKGGLLDGYNMCSNLADTIKVLSPNGGELYNPTNNVTLNWSFRHIDQIKIEYSSDSGSSWNLIVNDIPASQLSYLWTIPNTPSNQCLVKITSLRTGLSDVSDSIFTINSAFVNLTYPNGGENFGTGTGQYIEWDYQSVTTVKLEFSIDNGNSWTLIGTAPASNKYANWISPSTVTSQCRIRISDINLPSLMDSSISPFSLYDLPTLDINKYKGGSYDGYSMNSSIKDSIQVSSPNGGETWNSASTRTITWTYNDVDNVSVEYSLDDGQTWIVLDSCVPASQLRYDWTIPTTPSYTCRVRVRDILRPISDTSDLVFVIPNAYVQITYPNGGERFGTETGQYIEWDYNDLATIKLEYSTDSGITWNVIGTAAAANKYTNWVIPTIPSSNLFIRASDIDNPFYSDQSNAVFKSFNLPILDVNKFKGGSFDGYSMYAFKDVYVKVIKPNGGEMWGIGTTQQIEWSTLNTNDSLKVEYSIDNEATWNTLLNNVPNFPNSYNWTIPSPVSSICKVRATTMNGVVVDKSDDFFSIANPFGIITTPLTGSSFNSGSNSMVDFSLNNTFNAGNRFIVQLSDSLGAFSGSLINIGEISSTTPQRIAVTFPNRYYRSSLYRLRVIGTNPPTIGTDNGANFTIQPLPDVRLGNDTIICSGTILLSAASSGANSYLWSTGDTSASISVHQGGTYWVAATNNCGTSKDTIIITQKYLPTVHLGNDTMICINNVLTLDAGTNANSYLWSTGSTSRKINALFPGNYAVTVRNECGIATDNIVIGNRQATVVNLGLDRGWCPGQSISLNAGNNGATYLWSNGSTNQTIVVNSPGTYSVSVTDQCGTFSDQISIFNGSFNVNAGIDQSICQGSSAILSATGGNNYTWSSGQTTSTISVSPTLNTTYTVLATNIYGCTASDQVVVTVKAKPATPTISASSNTNFCRGDSVILSSSATSGNTWSNGSTANSIVVKSAGTFKVLASANGCLSDSSLATLVTINATPTITASTNTTFCSGDSVILTSSATAGNTWSNGSTANSIVVKASGSFKVLASANGCTSDSSLATVVTVNAKPATPTISASSNTTFCSGDSVILTSSATAGNIWSNGSSANSIVVKSAGTFKVMASANGCTSDSSLATVVTVNAKPAIPTISASSNTTFCSGDSVILNSSATSGNTWSNGSTSNSIVVKASGSFNVLATANGCTSDSSLPTVVTVNAKPATPTISASSNTTFCSGDSVILTSSALTGNTWSNGSTSNSIVVKASGSFNVLASANGCSSDSSLATVVTVNAKPATPTISASSNTTFCSGDSVILTSSATTGNTWSNGSSVNSIVVKSAGTFKVMSVVNGCKSDSSAPTITRVNPLPPKPIVTRYMKQIISNGSGPFQWYLNGVPVNGATNAAITLNNNGKYTVRMTNAFGCGIFSDTIEVKNIVCKDETKLLNEYSIETLDPLGISGLSEMQNWDFNVYPNPSKGHIQLKMSYDFGKPNCLLTITDLSGRIIVKRPSYFLNGTVNELDFSELKSGLYYLQIERDGLGKSKPISIFH